MRFSVIDHGRWLAVMGRQAQALMIVLGNPLIAWTMLRHDVAAGLNVPVRLSIHEDPEGKTRVSYDLPSSLMSFIVDGDLADAARELDRKPAASPRRSEEHTSELQPLMRLPYAVSCLKQKHNQQHYHTHTYH